MRDAAVAAAAVGIQTQAQFGHQEAAQTQAAPSKRGRVRGKSRSRHRGRQCARAHEREKARACAGENEDERVCARVCVAVFDASEPPELSFISGVEPPDILLSLGPAVAR